MDEKLRYPARQYIWRTQDSPAPAQLRASVVRATSEWLNICAGNDIGACAIPRIVDLSDLFTATGLLIDRDTARSWYKDLKKKRVYVS